jgi:hypothetical protein
MQKALARRMPLVIGSEYRSSQTSCCHHCLVTGLKSLGRKTRGVVVQCQACKTLLGRDLNAAAVIADVFTALQFTKESRPLWITDDATRIANSIGVFDDLMRSHEKKLEFYNSGRTFDWPEF